MREANWDELINSIVDRVLNKLEREMPQDENVAGTLALVTSYVPSPKTAGEALLKRYGEDMECALFGEAAFAPYGVKALRVGEDLSQDGLLQKAAEKGRVVLVTPKLLLLERIAQGNDDGFVEHVMLRSLLWGRKTVVLLDFSLPKFRRNTFFERIINTVDALTSMGMEILQYNCVGEKKTGRYALVTQTEVQDAAKNGEKAIFCEEGAIVTPLAREMASELGIAIS